MIPVGTVDLEEKNHVVDDVWQHRCSRQTLGDILSNNVQYLAFVYRSASAKAIWVYF